MIRIRNWEKFQHYKQRNPPWIKVHNTLLDDDSWEELSDAQRGQLVSIWMLASRRENAELRDDPKWIAKKIGASSPVNLEAFIDLGYLERDASGVLAGCEQDASDLQLSAEGETEQSRDRAEAEREALRAAFSEAYGSSAGSWAPSCDACVKKHNVTPDEVSLVAAWFKSWDDGTSKIANLLRSTKWPNHWDRAWEWDKQGRPQKRSGAQTHEDKMAAARKELEKYR